MVYDKVNAVRSTPPGELQEPFGGPCEGPAQVLINALWDRTGYSPREIPLQAEIPTDGVSISVLSGPYVSIHTEVQI